MPPKRNLPAGHKARTVSIPEDMDARLVVDAKARGVSVSTLIAQHLAALYGHEYAPPRRGWEAGRPKKPAPAE